MKLWIITVAAAAADGAAETDGVGLADTADVAGGVADEDGVGGAADGPGVAQPARVSPNNGATATG